MRLIGYSVALAQYGREDEALEALNLTISADPENPAAHRERGIWYARTGDLDRSIVDLRRTVDIQENGESLRDLGGALVARGLLDEGIPVLERALTQEDVPLGSVAVNLAACHRGRGDPAAAARVLDRAIAEDGRVAGDEMLTSLLRELRLTLLQTAHEQGVIAEAINNVFDARTEEEVAVAVDAAPFLPT